MSNWHPNSVEQYQNAHRKECILLGGLQWHLSLCRDYVHMDSRPRTHSSQRYTIVLECGQPMCVFSENIVKIINAKLKEVLLDKHLCMIQGLIRCSR